MSFWIALLNDIAVSLFGSVLSASFCNALETGRKRKIFWCCMAVLPLIQLGVYYIWDAHFLQYVYPLVVHVPLIWILYLLTEKLVWPVVSVLMAYLCCQLRHWIALLAAALFAGGDMMLNVVKIIITLPLLWLLLRFVSPAIRRFLGCPTKVQCRLGVVPALYYVFDYVACVYTELLFSGDPVVVQFMPFVCCLAYLVFLLWGAGKEQEQSRLQQMQRILNLQLTQAVREINALRESQTLTSRYRHDMRHHLQYLSTCIENGQTELAQAYIAGICQEMEAQKVHRYCENESLNLILSAFAGRAKKEGIELQIVGAMPESLRISDSDLCVLLSNALENAIYACQSFEKEKCVIDVQFYLKGERLFLQVDNPCREEVHFEHGIPISDRPGHGIGVQSICAIVERYGGVCTFFVKEGHFILRLSV